MYNVNRRAGLVRISLFVFGLLFAISASAGASSKKSGSFPNIKIDNFGQVDEHIYRGGQPKDEDFRALSALGVKTVVNLRDDAERYEEEAVEGSGMHYINIPMSSTRLPRDEQINEFLKIVDDTSNTPLYVHCAGGRHRTGVIVAVYRMTHYGWNVDQAYDEMKAYDFYTRWGHGSMKDYVFNYYKSMHRSEIPKN